MRCTCWVKFKNKTNKRTGKTVKIIDHRSWIYSFCTKPDPIADFEICGGEIRASVRIDECDYVYIEFKCAQCGSTLVELPDIGRDEVSKQFTELVASFSDEKVQELQAQFLQGREEDNQRSREMMEALEIIRAKRKKSSKEQ